MAATLIVDIQVENFDSWKESFDKDEQFRNQMGIQIQGVYRSVDNGNKVSLISQFPDMETAKKIVGSPQWESKQRESGVIGGFDITYCEKVG